MGRIRRWQSVAFLVGALLGGTAHADIVVGETVGLTGPVAATVKEALIGARLYIDWVNATGGVKGEKIELVTLDDQFDVKKAAENARVLIEEKNAVALFMNRGTPHSQAIMPLLGKHAIALVAPSTGAMLLHKPVNKYVFNVRAPYQREAQKAIEHLGTLGINRIAVVHVDDTFGADAMEGAAQGFARARLKPVAVVKADRDRPDYTKIVPPLVAANAQAVLWIGSGTAVSEGIKALRAAGSASQVVTLSNNASGGFIKLLGDAGKGVIVTQVFPYERSYAYPFVQEALSLAKESGVNDLSPAMLEGFAGAKVLVEALKRASPKATRAKVLAALESMKKFDLGGLEVSYSAGDHTGLEFADLSIIGADGRFRR
ncbi:MAG TPA: ABC transporter substrate-binding protein [Ramlibacter sp.]|nr:ABC transporter substrate-binding protein [Ramlibacter sp.]